MSLPVPPTDPQPTLETVPGPALPLTPDPTLLRRWALVLDAEGIAYEWGRGDGGAPQLLVPADQAERAAEALGRWQAENQPAPSLPPGRTHRGGGWLGILMAAGLTAFFLISGEAAAGSDWVTRGRADAGRILAGEPWRALTALMLHADLGHVLANAICGGLLLVAAAQILGPGLAILGTVMAGGLGNALSAWLRGPGSAAVGASTAVFGTVGLLAGLALDRRRRAGWEGGRLWLLLLAGLGLLALLGADPSSDVLSHTTGLIAGLPLGVLAGRVEGRDAGGWVQVAAIVATAILLGGAWALALRG